MDPTTDNIAVIVGVISAIGGLSGLAALLGVILSRRGQQANAKKTEAETSQQVPANAASTIADASVDIVSQYKLLLQDYQNTTDKKINDMKKEITGLKESSNRYLKRISYLLTGIQMLTEQIIGLDHEPCWSPNKWDPEEKPE